MQNKPILFRIYFLFAILASLLASALRTLACFLELNIETGYFDNKLYINAANGVAVAATAILLTYLFTAKGDRKLLLNLDSPLNYVFTGTLACSLILFSYRAFMIFREAREYIEKYKPYTYIDTSDKKIIMYIAVFTAVLALLSSLHFLSSAIFLKRRDIKRADLGLVTVIFLALYASYLYFNADTPINLPAKLTSQMAYLSAAIFCLYETRISIGREKWRSYSAFGFIAMLLTAYSSIPDLTIYIIKGREISDSIYETVLTFVLFLFILTRLMLTSSAKEDKPSKTAELIREASEARSLKLSPTLEIAESPDEDVRDELDPEEYYELNFEPVANAATNEPAKDNKL